MFLHTVAPDMFSSAKRELNGRNIIHYKFKRGISKLLGQEIICKNQSLLILITDLALMLGHMFEMQLMTMIYCISYAPCNKWL